MTVTDVCRQGLGITKLNEMLSEDIRNLKSTTLSGPIHDNSTELTDTVTLQEFSSETRGSISGENCPSIEGLPCSSLTC